LLTCDGLEVVDHGDDDEIDLSSPLLPRAVRGVTNVSGEDDGDWSLFSSPPSTPTVRRTHCVGEIDNESTKITSKGDRENT